MKNKKLLENLQESDKLCLSLLNNKQKLIDSLRIQNNESQLTDSKGLDVRKKWKIYLSLINIIRFKLISN